MPDLGMVPSLDELGIWELVGDWWSDAARLAPEADVRLPWHRELAHAPLGDGCCPCSCGFGAVLSVRENGSIKGTQLETWRRTSVAGRHALTS